MENEQDKMEKNGSGQADGVTASSGILISHGTRIVNFEDAEFTEEDVHQISMKVENEWRANDDTSGDQVYQETPTVTTDGIDVTLQSSAEDSDGQGQRSSCSCQEEIQSLKFTVNQLNSQMEKLNNMLMKQNYVISGMKSCIRNFAVSFTMFCDSDDEDFDGLQESPENIETSGFTVVDSQLLNPEVISSHKMRTSASFQSYSNEIGYNVGQRTSEEDKKTSDINDINFQDDDDKDSSYVPDENEAEEEPDQEMDAKTHHRATSSSSSNSAKSVKRKGGFQCWKCSKSFKLKKYLNEHMRRGHPEKVPTFKCHMCQKLFKKKWSLKLHIEAVHQGVRHKCTYCPGKFNQLKHVQRHEQQVHKSGTRPTQECQICGIHLLNSYSLHCHMSRVHKNI